MTLPMRDYVDHDVAVLLSLEPRHLNQKLAKHLAVVSTVFRSKREQIGHRKAVASRHLDNLVQSGIKEAEPDLVTLQRQLLY